MSEPKQSLKVFLCHASADKPAVRDLYKRLTADKVNAWLDAESLDAGQNWEEEIPAAIRASDVVIVCLSENSINREGYVQKEIKFALDKADEKPEGTIFIIPARLGECKVPQRLSMYHWVDLFSTEGYEKLMRALRKRAEGIGANINVIGSQIDIENDQSTPNKNTLKKNFNDLKNPNKIMIGSIGFLVFTFVLTLILRSLIVQSEIPINITSTISAKTSAPFLVSESQTLAFTPTLLPTSTPAPLLPEITDPSGVEMILVPAGEFIMGSERYSDSKPVHTVNLDDFYVDKYEVTNALYEMCVVAHFCQSPIITSSSSRKTYYGNTEFSSYPVIYLDWDMAKNYCEWRGARLLTEAEWEKAARGTDGRTYPWGEDIDCSFANYFGCTRDTTPVDEYPKGVSVYGVYNMVGNVAEWVSDWYLDNYYPVSPINNPTGPDFGPYHVVRGSTYPKYTLTVNQNLAFRNQYLGWADKGSDLIGVRCARTP